jgi:hypothetical protein
MLFFLEAGDFMTQKGVVAKGVEEECEEAKWKTSAAPPFYDVQAGLCA